MTATSVAIEPILEEWTILSNDGTEQGDPVEHMVKIPRKAFASSSLGS